MELEQLLGSEEKEELYPVTVTERKSRICDTDVVR